MVNLSFKLGGRRNLRFKLQMSSKGSACSTFGSSHVCSVSRQEESSFTPQLPFLAHLVAASPGSVLPQDSSLAVHPVLVMSRWKEGGGSF